MSELESITFGASFRSVPDMWHHRVGSTPDSKAMSSHSNGRIHSITWEMAGSRVRNITNGLLQLGVKKGDTIAIFGDTQVNWIVTDLAILCAGCVSTTLHTSTPKKDVRWILEDSGVKVVFTDTASRANLIRSCCSPEQSIQVIVWGAGAGEHSLNALEEQGELWGADNPEAYTIAHQQIRPEDPATLLYTSGTTGRPKGVLASHDSWVYEAEAIDALGLITPADVHYLLLPLSHVFARVLEYTFVRLGVPTLVDGTVENFSSNLQLFQPTWMAVVPRILERFHEAVLTRATQASAPKRALFNWSLQVGEAVVARQRQNKRVSTRLRLKIMFCDRMVFEDVRAQFGGRMRLLICGGAPLPTELGAFFEAIKLPVHEGYGLTESGGATCVNRPFSNLLGTVGQPLPGSKVKIANDGEVLIRSRGVMTGYHNDPELTQEVLKDGWLYTGDLGRVLPTGHLQITGRKKEIIVTATGKNIAPGRVESLLSHRCPYIHQVVLYGDRRPFCVALLTLNEEAVRNWSAKQQSPPTSWPALIRWQPLKDVLQGYVNSVNQDLPNHEKIRRITVLGESFSVENELMTASLKLRRNEIFHRYQREIDSMYSSKTTHHGTQRR